MSRWRREPEFAMDSNFNQRHRLTWQLVTSEPCGETCVGETDYFEHRDYPGVIYERDCTGGYRIYSDEIRKEEQ